MIMGDDVGWANIGVYTLNLARLILNWQIPLL